MTVKFAAKLSGEVPKTVTVYRLASVKVSATSLADTARALGLQGEGGDLVTGTESVALCEGRYRLEIHRRSGALTYHHQDKYGVLGEKPFELSDKQAEKLARAFLGKSELVPIANAAFRRVTHLQSAFADVKTGKVQTQVMDAGVVYTRLIDDVPVVGPGGIAMVSIDPAGEVVGLRRIWRELGEKVGSTTVLPPQAAMEAMEKFGNSLKDGVTVIKAEFGYFEQGPLESQRVIEPSYAFVYVQQSAEVARKSAFVIPAGAKAFARLLGEKRFPTALQKERSK
jgi:hypothetical protein